ncbi:Endoplasmic reticulum vesicle transporter [Ceratobasidium sp. AG-Ba]|nr:Endoplasmic reticulum vesicle transporter [Ceratobasidium sp. AG-Ba]
MARGLFGGAFKGVDGFGKTMDDVKVKTRTGASLTLLSAAVILFFTLIEFIDYRRVNIDEMIMVDRSRGERLTVKLNITFPRVPCYLLSLDVTDISGEIQQDISHNILKTRLDAQGQEIHENTLNYQISNEVERTLKQRPEGYCGSCYGADPPEGGCCQTCESVRKAYLDRGWSFEDPNLIEQCVAEHWTNHIHEQNTEGCRISGRARINKVAGNLQFSPGRSYISQRDPYHDLVPYLKDGSHHDFGHHIHEFHFEGEREVEDTWRPGNRMSGWRKKVGLETHQLDEMVQHAVDDRVTAANWMFQYYIKVVSTEFKYLDGEVVRSNQYSVTSFERDLTHEAQTHDHERDKYGQLHGHNYRGIPGAFFNFEISPLMVVHRETRGSFAHFITSLCAIIGGVLTMASIADSMLFAAMGNKDGMSSGKAM